MALKLRNSGFCLVLSVTKDPPPAHLTQWNHQVTLNNWKSTWRSWGKSQLLSLSELRKVITKYSRMARFSDLAASSKIQLLSTTQGVVNFFSKSRRIGRVKGSVLLFPGPLKTQTFSLKKKKKKVLYDETRHNNDRSRNLRLRRGYILVLVVALSHIQYV